MACSCPQAGKGYGEMIKAIPDFELHQGVLVSVCREGGNVPLTREPVAETDATDAIVGRFLTSAASDEELVDGLRNGEEASYELLVRSVGPLVLAISRRYLNSEADAADCFQETFIAVFKSIGNFAGQSSLRQWVRGVAVNQSLMALRKRKRTREESIEYMMPLFDESGSRVEVAGNHEYSSVETDIDTESVQVSVRQGIDKLPDDYRIVLLLRDIDGRNTQETAAIIGNQGKAVKTLLHRARTALKYILQPILEQTACDANV